MLLKPPCFTLGMVLAWWWAVPGFLQTWHLAFRLKSSSDQKTLFLIVWESFRCLLANSRSAVTCFHLANLPWWMQRWLFSWTGLLSPQSWSFVIVTIEFLVTCLTKAFLPLSLRVARSKKSLVGSKLLPFMNNGGLCAYWELPQICGLILSQRSKDNSLDLVCAIKFVIFLRQSLFLSIGWIFSLALSWGLFPHLGKVAIQLNNSITSNLKTFLKSVLKKLWFCSDKQFDSHILWVYLLCVKEMSFTSSSTRIELLLRNSARSFRVNRNEHQHIDSWGKQWTYTLHSVQNQGLTCLSHNNQAGWIMHLNLEGRNNSWLQSAIYWHLVVRFYILYL